jgi:hypothetical protein
MAIIKFRDNAYYVDDDDIEVVFKSKYNRYKMHIPFEFHQNIKEGCWSITKKKCVFLHEGRLYNGLITGVFGSDMSGGTFWGPTITIQTDRGVPLYGIKATVDEMVEEKKAKGDWTDCDEYGHDLISREDIRCRRCGGDFNNIFEEVINENA